MQQNSLPKKWAAKTSTASSTYCTHTNTLQYTEVSVALKPSELSCHTGQTCTSANIEYTKNEQSQAEQKAFRDGLHHRTSLRRLLARSRGLATWNVPARPSPNLLSPFCGLSRIKCLVTITMTYAVTTVLNSKVRGVLQHTDLPMSINSKGLSSPTLLP
jgi:hypothetical protein